MKPHCLRIQSWLRFGLLIFAPALRADIQMPGIFGDHMVLQLSWPDC